MTTVAPIPREALIDLAWVMLAVGPLSILILLLPDPEQVLVPLAVVVVM